MSADLVPDAVRRGTPTAKAVYLTLDHAGPLTYDDLAAELGTSRTAVETAIADLRDADLVTSAPDPSEPCRKRWRLT